MSSSVALRWGVVGPGAIARVFAEAVTQSRVGTIAAASGRSPKRLQSFCDDFDARAFDSVENLLGSDGIDAVYIATPHPMHRESVLAAIRAGVPVLCEKPLCVSVADTEAVIEAARQAKSPLVEAWMYRCHPQIGTAMEWIRQGVIGTPQRVESDFGFDAPFDPESRLYSAALGGGGILDVGGYPVSLAMAVAGVVEGARYAAPVEIEATGECAPTGVDASAHATLVFASGLVARVSASVDRDTGMTAEVIGDRGRLRFETPFMPEERRLGVVARLHLVGEDGAVRTEELVADADCFSLEARAMAGLVHGGGIEAPAPMVSHDESVAIARVLERWRSAVVSEETMAAAQRR